MRLALLLLFYFSSTLAYWRTDSTTGWLWDGGASAPPSTCATIPPTTPFADTCCPLQQEPFTADFPSTPVAASKLYAAIPSTTSNLAATIMNAGTARSLCPAFQGSWYAYGPDGFKEAIGTATISWGGATGLCLQVNIDIPLICWSAWQARIGVTSIANFGSFPPFEPSNTSLWIQGVTGDSCTRGDYSFQICPNDPPVQTGTGTSFSQFQLMGCYQSIYISFHLNLTTAGYTDGWLVPNPNGLVIPGTSGVCPTMAQAGPPSTCTATFSSFPCHLCINNTNCCSEQSNALYGQCASSAQDNCPGAGTTACSGGNCPDPSLVRCITVLQPCPSSTRCYGKTACHPILGCAPGYFEDQFCYWNGASGQLKICCTVGVSSIDGTSSSSPTCQSYCYDQSFQLQCRSSTGTVTQNCGNATIYITGNYFYVEITTGAAYNISAVQLYMGNTTSQVAAGSWTYTYQRGAEFADYPFGGLPTFNQKTFVVSYDLLRPFGGPTGFLVPCKTSFNFVLNAIFTNSGGANFTAALPATSPTPWGLTSTQTQVSGATFAWSLLVSRCCKGQLNTTAGCGAYPCSQTIKFLDEMRWGIYGTEFQTERCCGLDRLLDFILPVLPEGGTNTGSNTIFTLSNVSAVCNVGTCTMGITYLYEGTDNRNQFGYYFINSATGAIETSPCPSSNGYCTIFPDVSGRSMGGCLKMGDTIVISVPSGKSVGFWLRPSGFSWSNRTGGSQPITDKFYSRTSSQLTNTDGNTIHFAWYTFAGSFLLAMEESVGLTSKDYNDAIFGVKLTGNWTAPGLPPTDPCIVATFNCLQFAPYSYATSIYTPSCVPYITLDTAVGTSSAKDCTGYYAIPDGWEIATMDSVSIGAAQTYSYWWVSPCAVGLTATSGWIGYNTNGTCSNYTVNTISDGVNTCYNLGCGGQLLLRRINYLDPDCNANNYGLYCNPAQTGSYYTNVTNSQNPSDLYLNLVPNVSYTAPLAVPVLHRIQIYVLIDLNSLTISASVNEPQSMAATIQQLPVNTGFYPARYIGYGITTAANTTAVNCAFTYNNLTLGDTIRCPYPNPAVSDTSRSNTLEVLNNMLATPAPSFGWLSLIPRFIYVPTKNSFASYTSTHPAVTTFRSLVQSTGINVVFINFNTAGRTFVNSVLCAGLPRCVNATPSGTYPNINLGGSANQVVRDIQQQATYWQPAAAAVAVPLSARIDINLVSEDNPPTTSFIVSNPPVAPYFIPGFGTNYQLADYQVYNITPGATYRLPAGVPGTGSAAWLPHTINWIVPSLLSAQNTANQYTFKTYVTWNEPPVLWANATQIVRTYVDTDPVPFYIGLLPSIATQDPNFNNLDIIFLTSQWINSNPPSPTGWVQNATGVLGTDNGALIATPGNVRLNTRFNIIGFNVFPVPTGSGTWNLTYVLSDGCSNSSVGTISITYFPIQTSPICNSITGSVVQNSTFTVDFPSIVTASNLGSCAATSPSTTYVSTCNSTGAQLCSSAPATCPGGSSFLCSGVSCPGTSSSGTVYMSCVPFNGTCTSGFCGGYTQCGSSGFGCPQGFQPGMWCVLNGVTKSFSVCCTQVQPNNVQITLKDTACSSYRSNFGFTYQLVTPGNPLVACEVPFVSAAVNFRTTTQAPPGNYTWPYTVSFGGKTATCNINLTVIKLNTPPVIYVNNSTQTASLTSVPGQTIFFNVTITDADIADLETLFIVNQSGILVNFWNNTKLLVDSSLTPNPTIQTLVSNTSAQIMATGLVLNPSGSITMLMTWTPSLLYPYNSPSTFTLFARDNSSATSNLVNVVLNILPNQPPVCDSAMIGQYNISQYGSSFPVLVVGSDPNIQDTTVLNFTFTTLPSKGTLTFLGQAVQTNVMYTYLQARTSTTQTANKTTYLFTYTPGNRSTDYGLDSFSGYFTDTVSTSTSLACPLRVNITFVPTPPDTVNISRTTSQNVAVALPIPATSKDGTLNSMVIQSVNLQYPGLANVTYNGVAITPGMVIPISPAGAFTFNFQYVTSQYQAINDFFTYRVTDSNGLNSTIYYGTITGAATPQPPVVQSTTINSTQGSNVTVPINFGNLSSSPSNLFFDVDSNRTQVQFVVTSLPPVGTLYFPDGTPVTIGSVVNTSTLIYDPPANYVPTVSFNFRATDNTNLNSTTGTVTINYAPTVTPPVISLSQNLTLARGTTGSFTVSVYDNDSPCINIFMTNAGSFPFTCTLWNGTTNVPCSTFTTPAGVLSTSNLPTDPLLLATLTNPVANWGLSVPLTITLTWAPNYNYYDDNKTGTFQVYAVDCAPTSLRSVDTPTGKVNILPNNPPEIYNPPQYTISVPEGTTSVPILLQASDPQTWQSGNLRLDLLTPSSDGTVYLQYSGSNISSYPSTYGFATGFGSASLTNTGAQSFNATLVNRVGTQTPITAVISDPNWNGQTWFLFQAVDSLGLTTTQNVTITVTPVNDPPQTQNTTIVVYEYRCVLATCGAYQSPVVWSNTTASDIDSSTLRLTLGSLPGANQGVLTYTNAPTGPVASVGPYTSTDGTWYFDYQPTPGTFNSNCANLADWTTCTSPFIAVPFTVSDGEFTTTTSYINVYILFVNSPPQTTGSFTNVLPQQTKNVAITGTDVDSNLQTLVIVEVSINGTEAGRMATSWTYPGGGSFTNCADQASCSLNFTLGQGSGNTASTTWTTTYFGDHLLDNVDYIKYYVVDSYGNVSSVQTATVASFQLTPPVAQGETTTTPENQPVNITFNYGNPASSSTNNIWLNETKVPSPSTTTLVRIDSLPTNGVLTYNGVAVTVGQVINASDPSVTYTPTTYWNGQDSFLFTAVDTYFNQLSNQAQMNITVTPVDQPPTIVILPGSVTTDRTVPVSQVVEVSDIDSDRIDVFINNNFATAVNGEFEQFLYSSLVVTVNGVNTTYNAGSLFNTNTATTFFSLPNPTLGVPMTVTLTWLPFANYPYNVNPSGDITLYAKDTEGLRSLTNATGIFNVSPNNPPVTTGTYVVNEPSQQQYTVPLTLTGTDPDPWHDTTLTVTLTSFPNIPGVNITQGSTVGTVFTIDNTGTTSGTSAPITLNIPPDYWGTFTFNYTVTDAAGATSEPNTVTVTVAPNPPTANNVTIVVPENCCVSNCQPGQTVCPPVVLPCSALTANLTIPQPLEGGGFSVNGTTVDGVTWNGPCNYTVFYQPPPNQNSNCTDTANLVTGAGCDPFTEVPVTVCDVATGLCTTTNITVIVTPVYLPPITYDTFGYNRTVTLTPIGDIQAVGDVVVSITITGINFVNSSTTLTYMGVPVVLNTPYPGDGSGWPFDYTNIEKWAVTDTFTYFVTNKHGLPSNNATGTITVPYIWDPPVTGGAFVTTPQETPIPIDFQNQPPVSNDTTTPTFFNPDPASTQNNLTVIIETLPTLGTLQTSTGTPIPVGVPIDPSDVVYVPFPGTDNVNDTFTFKATDPVTGDSTTSTVTIFVSHINLAPTISIDPPMLTVPRGEEQTFSVTVSDPDSPSIDVYITGLPSFPFTSATADQWSTLTVYYPNGTVAQTYQVSPGDNVALIHLDYPTPADIGSNMTFTIGWTPSYIIPDGTTGSFLLQAFDTQGLPSGSVSGAVAVVPNEPPSVVPSPEYTVVVNQSSTPLVIPLTGTDVETYHQQNLTIQITSVPQGFLLCDPATLDVANVTPSCVPLTVENVPIIIPGTGVNGNSTTGNVTLVPDPSFFGNTSFTFVVTDPLGKVSEPQTVTIQVNQVNQPPASQNIELYVYESSCAFPECSPPNIVTLRFATVTGRDPDPGDAAALTLSWLTVPDSTSLGDIGFVQTVGDTFLTRLTQGTSQTLPDSVWNFWFQPIPSLHSDGCTDNQGTGCAPFASATFQLTDPMGKTSEVYNFTIYVIPVNDPPECEDYDFTIDMNANLTVYYNDSNGSPVYKVWASDPDNTDSEITSTYWGVVNSKGQWFSSSDVDVTAASGTPIPDRWFKYVPEAFDYSRDGLPVTTMTYKNVDLGGLESRECKIRVFVNWEPQPCVWIGTTSFNTQENTALTINLNSQSFYQTNDTTARPRFLLTSVPPANRGYFFVCNDGGVCSNITASVDNPWPIPPSGFKYQPPTDDVVPNYGQDFVVFDFVLQLLDPQGNVNPASICNPPIHINVDPVNDAPKLVPQGILIGGKVVLDENTTTLLEVFPPEIAVPYICFEFVGSDVDSAANTLSVFPLKVPDEKTELVVFICEPGMAEPCFSGPTLASSKTVSPTDPVRGSFKFCVQGVFRVFGRFSLSVAIFDSFAYSVPGTFDITIRPINDFPSIVRGASNIIVEYYKVRGAQWALDKDRKKETASFTITDKFAQNEKEKQGQLLDKASGSQTAPTADESQQQKDDKIVTIYRLRTTLQDYDFTFQKSLNMTVSLIKSTFPTDLIDVLVNGAQGLKRETEAQARFVNPCAFSYGNMVNCFGDISVVNNYLNTIGLPLMVDDGAESAVALILLADLGNIDYLSRPLQSGFVVTISLPTVVEPLAAPIAAIVILPVIAAATAAAIAAAWIALGQRAQNYANQRFDHFAVNTAAGGNQSPLYDAKGLEVNSPLYNGQ